MSFQSTRVAPFAFVCLAMLGWQNRCAALEQIQRYKVVPALSGGLTPGLAGEFELIHQFADDAMPGDQPIATVFANTDFSSEPFDFIGQLEGLVFTDGQFTNRDTIPLHGEQVSIDETYLHVQDVDLTGYRTWIDVKVGGDALWLFTYLEERPGSSITPPNGGVGPEFIAIAVPEPGTLALALLAAACWRRRG